MNCDLVQDMLGAYADGELDAASAMQIRAHLAECADCPDAYRRLMQMKESIKADAQYFQAPEGLEARIRESLRKAEPKSARPSLPQWLAVAAAVLLAVSLGLSAYLLRSRSAGSQLLASQLVAGHVRAMMGTHLMDVPSTDQHTVKPWFEGKLDFSPPVKDLKDLGFPLIGGRLDYIANRPVAALVYQRRKHIIDLFVWPDGESGSTLKAPKAINGFNIIESKDGPMRLWAVSDLNAKELKEFVDGFTAR